MDARKELNTQIGIQIKKARESRTMTQEKLAELIDITPHFLSSVERGVAGISLEKLCTLCKVLGVSSDSLLFGNQSNEPMHNILPINLSESQAAVINSILINCLELITVSKQDK